MIDQKEILEASIRFASAEFKLSQQVKSHRAIGFHSGALWAQREFLKSIWHDAEEEPTKEGVVIGYWYADGELRSFTINWLEMRKDFFEMAEKKLTGKDALTDEELEEHIHKSWRDFKDRGLRKWCYISDILPQEGGEQ